LNLIGETLEIWFAELLRDAFALDATDVYRSFRDIASATLTSLAAVRGIRIEPDEITRVLEGFAELDAHSDAQIAFRRLHEAGIRILTLTNGSPEVTHKLFRRAGLERFVERLISVEEVGHWKPRREVYLHAARCAGVEPHQLALIAAHAWDIHGGGMAGLTTAYVERGKPYPALMKRPDISGRDLVEAAGTHAAAVCRRAHFVIDRAWRWHCLP
jgi:2-haloacid dehalogenase